MASGSEILTSLLFQVKADTAQLKQGLAQAKQDVTKFSEGINKLKGLIAGAFTVTAIIGAAKAVFSFAQEIDDVIGKIDDLGASLDAVGDAAKVKAIADVFGMEVDPIIKAANATAAQFGITFAKSLEYIQQGLALAGTDSAKYLKSLEAQAAAFNALGGTADQYFAIVTNGYRNSTEFERELKEGRSESIKQFSELTSQLNEGQLIQQELINSSTELNKVWTRTFDGTGDGVDKLKIGFNKLAVGAINGLKDIANWFIEIYNKSMLFRGVIQTIILNFKLLWETVKLVFKSFFTLIQGAGELLKAVFTANFSDIPGILRKYFNEAVDNVVDFGKNSAQGFVDAWNNTVNAEPITLISDEEAEKQGERAAKNFKKGKDKYGKVNLIVPKEPDKSPQDVLKDIDKEGRVSLDKGQGTKINLQPYDKEAELIKRNQDLWRDYGDVVNNVASISSNLLVDMFDSIVSGNKDAAKSFKDVTKVFKETAKQYIALALAQTLAETIKDSMFTTKNPIAGLVLAGIATAAVTSLFSAIPAFATSTNGLSTNSGMFIAGESQGRGELVINTGRGSRVYNHSQTKSMLSHNNQPQQLFAIITGENLRLTTEENTRRVYNSR